MRPQSDSVKRRGCNLARKTTGIVPSGIPTVGRSKARGDGTIAVPHCAMLSVPTLWTVMVINFLALGLIWAYVQRTYPSFEAARYWTGSAFMCATAAAVATLRGVMDESLLPMLAAGTIMVLATCLAAMGIRCFYEKEVNWERTALITANAFLGMGFFIYVHDSAPARLTIFTAAQALPLVLSLKMLLSPPDGRKNAGALSWT